MPTPKDNTYDDAESIIGINTLNHVIFTDGSCNPNNKSKKSRGGYAASFVSGPFKDKCLYGNLPIDVEFASNIRAEGLAIIRTLEVVRDCEQKWNKCDIYTDCKFWMDMVLNYMPKWKPETYSEKSNPDLTKRMWVVYNELCKIGEVKFIHMRSHNKDGWNNFADGTFEKYCYDQNDFADQMCGYARKNLQPGDEIFEAVDFE